MDMKLELVPVPPVVAAAMRTRSFNELRLSQLISARLFTYVVWLT